MWLWPKTTASAAGKRARIRATRPLAGPASWTTAMVWLWSSISSDSGSASRSPGSSTFPWTARTTGQGGFELLEDRGGAEVAGVDHRLGGSDLLDAFSRQ
jgi:hypothetical protein